MLLDEHSGEGAATPVIVVGGGQSGLLAGRALAFVQGLLAEKIALW